MTRTETLPTQSGTWLAIGSGSRISYRVEDADNAQLLVSGAAELELGMGQDEVRQCISVLSEALETMQRADEPSP